MDSIIQHGEIFMDYTLKVFGFVYHGKVTDNSLNTHEITLVFEPRFAGDNSLTMRVQLHTVVFDEIAKSVPELTHEALVYDQHIEDNTEFIMSAFTRQKYRSDRL